jgi:hypothetical protein
MPNRLSVRMFHFRNSERISTKNCAGWLHQLLIYTKLKSFIYLRNSSYYKKAQHTHTHTHTNTRGGIQKFPDSVDNEIHAYNNKQSLRSNTKGYGGKTH